jgi:hypothetical protein
MTAHAAVAPSLTRRTFAGAGFAVSAVAFQPAFGSTPPMTFDPVPPLPVTPTPGKPGDFDFLTGEWRIANRSIVNGAWLAYDSEATVHAILKGIGSVEELRIPARDFSGMGLRLLDVEKRVWSDFWVNAKSGVLTSPGQTGSFENGAGIFSSDYEDNGRTMKSAGIWDRITPTSCRWRQVVSADGGKTWEHNWIMDWTRVGAQ